MTLCKIWNLLSNPPMVPCLCQNILNRAFAHFRYHLVPYLRKGGTTGFRGFSDDVLFHVVIDFLWTARTGVVTCGTCFFVLVPDVLCGRIWNFREPSSLCDIPATLNHPNKTIFFGRVMLASGSLRYSHEKCNNNVDVYITESFVK
jgi:hypothetical protein